MTNNLRSTTRIGLHYFPDTIHYREQDLQTWLPELKSLGISWLTLIAPSERAIPEVFLRGLLEAGIEPILHFPLLLDAAATNLQLNLLLDNYARWGVRYVALFDRPNIRRSWPSSTWAQTDLVERFIDIFIPQAESALQAGLTPIFPPLEPGGDYWDTAFLQSALQAIIRRGQTSLTQAMGLGINAWTYNRPLDWGAGGPESWPGAQPYYTPTGSQDHIGFRIFDWYQATAQAEIGRALPMFILRAGSRPGDFTNVTSQAEALRKHAECNLSIVQLVADLPKDRPAQLAVNRISFDGENNDHRSSASDMVQCINFWLLSANPDNQEQDCAWYKPDGTKLPVVNVLKQWTQSQKNKNTAAQKNMRSGNGSFEIDSRGIPAHPIEHYLLMPIYAWGVADWDLEAIRPFVQQYHPTIGFSSYEAQFASRVTLFGEAVTLPEETLNSLHASGCQVERMNSDGTLLAI